MAHRRGLPDLSRAASPTPTATASATSPACAAGWTTWPKLGVDAIWLSPFYPSPLADGGYDITDYRDVDPRLGTLADFDSLAHDAHTHGIKVIVDIVPNHTSDQHPWFRAALAAGPGSSERDRYIFRDGTGPDGSASAVGLAIPLRWQRLGTGIPTASGTATCSPASNPT